VQRHPEIISSAPLAALPVNTSDDMHYGQELSKGYAELRRLRQQVEIAESFARAFDKPSAISRTRAG